MIFGIPFRLLQQIMSAPDFAEYIAFSHIEPIGEDRADARAALMAAHNLNGQGANVSAADLMPRWEPETREEFIKRMRAKVLAWAGAMNKVNKEKTA